MTIDPISGAVTQSTPLSQALGAAPGAGTTPGKEMDKDTFLKLLVAQLKYQDPANPTDSAQFMAQTAQFSSLEKLNEVAKLNVELLAAQRVLGASGMVGRTVTFTAQDGAEVTGVVTSARLEADGPKLKIGTAEVAMSAVREVSNGYPPTKS